MGFNLDSLHFLLYSGGNAVFCILTVFYSFMPKYLSPKKITK